MDGGHRERQPGAPDELAPLTRNPERRTEERLGGGRPQTDHELRLDHLDFRIEPGTAGGDLRRIRLLVQPPLPLWFPLEVLDRVGHVDTGAVDARLEKGFVQQVTRGADERFAFDVFSIARLLSHHDHPGSRLALAENRLGGIFPEIAGTAFGRRTLQRWERLLLEVGARSGSGQGEGSG